MAVVNGIIFVELFPGRVTAPRLPQLVPRKFTLCGPQFNLQPSVVGLHPRFGMGTVYEVYELYELYELYESNVKVSARVRAMYLSIHSPHFKKMRSTV